MLSVFFSATPRQIANIFQEEEEKAWVEEDRQGEEAEEFVVLLSDSIPVF